MLHPALGSWMRWLLGVAVLGGVVLAGALWHRHERRIQAEEQLIARFQQIADQHMSQEAVEKTIGEPQERRRAGDCAEEWVYTIGAGRKGALCFDASRRVTGLRVLRSFDRQDY